MSSSVTDRKPPNRGQKVDQGRNAPVTLEGAGIVEENSLAAESYREGGGFASNRGANPDEKSSRAPKTLDREENQATSTPRRRDENSASDTRSQNTAPARAAEQSRSGHDAPAPTYVNNLYHRDPHGPHGKNLTEGFEDTSKLRDGMRAAIEAEVGSEDDPARAAQSQFQNNQRPAAADRGSGEMKVGGDGTYDTLKTDEPV